jgi:hypothetical protein
MRIAAVIALTVVWCSFTSSASAQDWDTDARSVALGGLRGPRSVFVTEQQRGERSFGVPLGLFRVLMKRELFTPSSSRFNPILAMELAASPMHLQLGHGQGTVASQLVSDIRNSTLDLDPASYRNALPANFATGAHIIRTWGHTFAVTRRPDSRVSHGIYAGAGPYLSLDTALQVDDDMRRLLGSRAANTTGTVANQSKGQLAAALTTGYRGAFPLGPDHGGTTANALNVSVNVNTLRGFRYEDFDTAIQLETDPQGLLVLANGKPASLGFTRVTSTSGAGLSFDVRGSVTLGSWQFGVEGNNLANRLTWRDVTSRGYSLDPGSAGVRFDVSTPAALDDVRVHLPPSYQGNLAFRGRSFTALSEVTREWDRTRVRAGAEQRFAAAELRGAINVSRGMWLPSAGVSLRLSPGTWADASIFGSAANFERTPRYALAMSIRVAPGRR